MLTVFIKKKCKAQPLDAQVHYTRLPLLDCDTLKHYTYLHNEAQCCSVSVYLLTMHGNMLLKTSCTIYVRNSKNSNAYCLPWICS